MTRTTLAAVALAAGMIVGGLGFHTLSAAPQLFPNPGVLRFRLVGDEPVSSPDGQSIVTGATACPVPQ